MSFDEFWKQYPRKVAKKEAMKAWSKLSPEAQSKAVEAISTHCRYWEACNTDKEFIPHCSTWLNGWRFEDELEMPKPKVVENAWWTNDQAIEQKARECGISTYGRSRQEVIDLVRKAA
jgi:hypothetical protein